MEKKRGKMTNISLVLTVIVMLFLGIADSNSCIVDSANIRCVETLPEVIPSSVVGVSVLQLKGQLREEDFTHHSWTQITYLDINLYYATGTLLIRNFTFVNLTSLKHFGLHGRRRPISIERSAFFGLDLHHLDLSGCTALADKDVIQALLPKNATRNLTTLNLDYVNTRDVEQIYLNADFFEAIHYKNMLTSVSMHGTNLIYDVKYMNKTYLSNSIKYLNISSTSAIILSKIKIPSGDVYRQLFPSLEVLDISNFEMFKQFSFVFIEDQHWKECEPQKQSLFDFFMRIRNIYANGILYASTTIKDSSLNISRCKMLIESIQLRNNKLRVLDVRITAPNEKHLLEIDLSFNEIEYISPDLLKEQTKIEKIDLGNNRLYKMERSDIFSDLFATFTKLKELHLNKNHLTTLPYNILLYNKNLRVLDLSGNTFESLSFKVEHLSVLELLDLSNNAIKTISGPTMDFIKGLLKDESSPNSFHVNFKDNTFECSCDNEHFIEWLHNDVQAHTADTFQCYIEGHIKDIGENIVSKTKFLCYKLIVIVSCLAVLCFIFVIVFLVLFLRRRRERIEKTTRFLNEFKNKKLNDIEWLGMVSYSSEDGDLVIKHIYDPLQNCLKTILDVPFSVICNNETDFQPGTDVAAEIVRCVSESCVLIVAVSETYCKKHWCSREVDEAYKQGKPIILVFLEHVDEDKMPPFLRKIFQRYTRVKLVNINGEYRLHPAVEDVSKSIIRLALQSYVSDSCCKIC